MSRILAETHFDNDVKLLDREGADLPYTVTYGQLESKWDTFPEAWDEFLSCSAHSARCASLLDDEDDL